MASEREKTGRPGELHLDSWAGRQQVPVTVLGRTAKRLRVRLEADCIKGAAGTVRSVPAYAVTERAA